MRIVNVKTYGGIAKAREAGVVYCGRPTCVGNPYTHLNGVKNTVKVATRQEAIRKYKQWLWDKICRRDPAIIGFLNSLTENSILGCWCVPEPCHCEVLIQAWQWWKDFGLDEDKRCARLEECRELIDQQTGLLEV